MSVSGEQGGARSKVTDGVDMHDDMTGEGMENVTGDGREVEECVIPTTNKRPVFEGGDNTLGLLEAAAADDDERESQQTSPSPSIGLQAISCSCCCCCCCCSCSCHVTRLAHFTACSFVIKS